MPLTPGMPTSMSTSRGSAPRRSIASIPSPASPTTSMSAASSSTSRTPWRNSAWSIDQQDSYGRVDRRRTTAKVSRVTSMRPSCTVAPAVEHRGSSGVGVGNRKKSWPSSSICSAASSDVHRLHRELLGLHDRRVTRCRPRSRRASRRAPHRRRSEDAGRRALRSCTVLAPDPAFVQPAHLLLDLVEGEVERHHVLGSRGRALHEVMA